MLRLSFLGTPTIQKGGATLDVLAAQPKRLALLAYLAVQTPEAEARDRLLPMFWPESDSDHARASLRQAIHFIKAATGLPDQPDLITARRGKVGLERDQLWCDVVEFDSLLTAGDYTGALALYRGEFLQGIYVPGAPDFEHWLDRERTRLRRAAEMACLNAAEQEIEAGSLRGALYWAHRGEAIAPTNESFIRMLMTLTERIGDRPQALQKFKDFDRWLRTEHLIEPSAETVALAEQIRQRVDAPAKERRTTPTEDLGAILKYHTPPRPRPAVMKEDETEEAALYRELVEGASDMIYTADEHGRVRTANKAATHLLGFTLDELRKFRLFDLVEPESRNLTIEFYQRQIRDRVPTSYYEFPIRTAAGRTIWIGQIVHIMEKGEGRIALHGVARDITEWRETRGEVPLLEWRDPQTGLYNEKAFMVLSEHRHALASETGMPLDFLAITVKDLEKIELEKGVAEAERAVILIGQALQESFRRSDVVARLTKNRFVVIGSDWKGQGLSSSISRLSATAASRAAIRLGYRVELDISRVHQPASIGPSRRAISRVSLQD